MVIYYNLPPLDKETELNMTISDEKGNLVNTFSSNADIEIRSV